MSQGLQLKMNDILMIEPNGSELLIMHSHLNLKTLYARWNRLAKQKNYGAVVNFTGFVREEGILAVRSENDPKENGLYFEMYEPLLVQWFMHWKEWLESSQSFVCMAHSIGFVPLHKSSFSVSILSSKRRNALEQIDVFVEDFKANAPIWKYDQVGKERHFAKDRAKPMQGSGLFGEAQTLKILSQKQDDSKPQSLQSKN